MFSSNCSLYEYKSRSKRRIFDQLGTQWWGKEDFYCWYFYWLAYKLHQTPITSEFVFQFTKLESHLKKSHFLSKKKKLKSERSELSAAGLGTAAEGGVSANNVYKNATFLGDFQTSCFVRISKNKFFSP